MQNLYLFTPIVFLKAIDVSIEVDGDMVLAAEALGTEEGCKPDTVLCVLKKTGKLARQMPLSERCNLSL